MRHSHAGTYVSKTPKGFITHKKRPEHDHTWVGKRYVHGPRQKKPTHKRFYTVSSKWARKRELGVNPPTKDSKVIVGEKDKKLEVQSYITPVSKVKGATYKELKERFKLKPYEDADNDGVLNAKDCRPFDKKKHVFFDDDLGPDKGTWEDSSWEDMNLKTRENVQRAMEKENEEHRRAEKQLQEIMERVQR